MSTSVLSRKDGRRFTITHSWPERHQLFKLESEDGKSIIIEESELRRSYVEVKSIGS
jgi:hypothetical protein